MASFLINSGRQTESGTVFNDQFVVVDGANRNTLQGNGADDRFDLTTFTGDYAYGNSLINGNAGRDTINIKVSGNIIATNFFGGGADRDLIAVSFQSAKSFVGNTLNGGDGNDSIIFSAGTCLYFTDLTINGNAGDDIIDVSGIVFTGELGSKLSNVLIGGGQGTDYIDVNFSADESAAMESLSIAGGQGIDIINFDVYDMTAKGLVINGGTLGTDDALDAGDYIKVSSEVFVESTINGNQGDDFIDWNSNADYTSRQVLIAGNRGDDTIFTTGAGSFDGVTLGGGKGDDLIVSNTGDAFSAGQNSILGGLGNDTIAFENGTAHSANHGLTIEGGAGADLIISYSAFAASGYDVKSAGGRAFNGGNFRFASNSDSTLGESDTIYVSTGSGTYNLIVSDQVRVFNGRLDNTDFKFSGGVLRETGDFSANLNLATMVALLDANLSTGDAVAFKTDTGLETGDEGYVFVKGKGGEDDLLVTFGVASGFSANNTVLRNPGATTLKLELNQDSV